MRRWWLCMGGPGVVMRWCARCPWRWRARRASGSGRTPAAAPHHPSPAPLSRPAIAQHASSQHAMTSRQGREQGRRCLLGLSAGVGRSREPSLAQPQPSGKTFARGLGSRAGVQQRAQPCSASSFRKQRHGRQQGTGAHRSGGAERREIRLVLDAGPAEVCRDRAGADSVDTDAARRIIHSDLPGEAEDPCPRTNFSGDHLVSKRSPNLLQNCSRKVRSELNVRSDHQPWLPRSQGSPRSLASPGWRRR